MVVMVVVVADNGNKPRGGEKDTVERRWNLKREEGEAKMRKKERGEKTGVRTGVRESWCASHEGESPCGGRKKDARRRVGDLRIHGKKEQGGEAGRYYEQCANRVGGFSPLALSLSVFPVCFVAAALFSLRLILVYYSMGPGGAR